jgi:hypothetical protein
LLGGAALFAVNDGPFQPSDARNITRLGSNSKAGEATAAGRFGLGLKSVFHLCEAFFYLASPPQSGHDRTCPRSTIRASPEGTLFETMRAGFRASGLTQPVDGS